MVVPEAERNKDNIGNHHQAAVAVEVAGIACTVRVEQGQLAIVPRRQRPRQFRLVMVAVAVVAARRQLLQQAVLVQAA